MILALAAASILLLSYALLTGKDFKGNFHRCLPYSAANGAANAVINFLMLVLIGNIPNTVLYPTSSALNMAGYALGNVAQPAVPQPVAAKIQYPQCHTELPANAKFCFGCGAEVEALGENEMLCPKCGQKTPKGKFCMQCGAPLSNNCPNGGKEVPDGAKFCLECGQKL